jgi:hypothetical protein
MKTGAPQFSIVETGCVQGGNMKHTGIWVAIKADSNAQTRVERSFNSHPTNQVHHQKCHKPCNQTTL